MGACFHFLCIVSNDYIRTWVHWNLLQNSPYLIGNRIQSKLCESFSAVEITLDILCPSNQMKTSRQLICMHILTNHIIIILTCHLLTCKFFLLLISWSCEYQDPQFESCSGNALALKRKVWNSEIPCSLSRSLSVTRSIAHYNYSDR